MKKENLTVLFFLNFEFLPRTCQIFQSYNEISFFHNPNNNLFEILPIFAPRKEKIAVYMQDKARIIATFEAGVEITPPHLFAAII